MVEEVMRFRRPRMLALLLLAIGAIAPAALAHRLDEYLQATLVGIAPGEIRLYVNLTPGVEVAERVLAEIDRDRGGVISAEDATAYCQRVMHDLIAAVDDRRVELKLARSNFPEPDELRGGSGVIQMEFVVMTGGAMAAGAHRFALENRHLPSVSVHLFNAAQARVGSEIEIVGQKRNDNQSVGEIEFGVRATAAKGARGGGVGRAPVVALIVGVLVAGLGVSWVWPRSARARGAAIPSQ
jgi:hypothetical protein